MNKLRIILNTIAFLFGIYLASLQIRITDLEAVNTEQMKLNTAVQDTFDKQGELNALVIEKLK